MKHVRKAFLIGCALLLLATWVLLLTLQSKLLLTGLFAIPFLTRSIAPRLRQIALGVLCLCVLAVGILMPARMSHAGSRVQSVVLDAHGQRVPMPWVPYLANLVPEADLIRVSTLLAKVFPLPARGGIRDEFWALPPLDNVFVREARAFLALGFHRESPSVLPLQLLQQLGLYRGLHHFVLVRPAQAGGPRPLVVFLHGYMGNFQLYSSLLAGLAEVPVLLPSTRDLHGLWPEQELGQVLGPDLAEAKRLSAIDGGQVHLVGLSNGGSGVNLAVQARGTAFRSFTFVSTGIEEVPEGFPRATPIGIVYGTQDVMAQNNLEMAAWLAAQARPSRVLAFPGERHFALLTKKDDVLALLRALVDVRQPVP